MDPALRTAALVFAAAFSHALLMGWWQRFKASEARKPITMKLHKGVYVPWGRVQRIERWINLLFVAWLAYIALLAFLLLTR